MTRNELKELVQNSVQHAVEEVRVLSSNPGLKKNVRVDRRTAVSRIRDTSPKRVFAEKNRRMRHFAEKSFMANLPNTVKNLILCQDFKM